MKHPREGYTLPEDREAEARRERNRQAFILGFRLLALIGVVWLLIHLVKS